MHICASDVLAQLHDYIRPKNINNSTLIEVQEPQSLRIYKATLHQLFQ
jgi:hypothetical protein